MTFDQQTAARASLEVALLIGRKKIPHTIGEEMIKPAAVKMVEIMCGPEYFKRLDSVSSSAKTIKHRISNLGQNVREQVIASIALQLDETTDVSNHSKLKVYVRY